MFLALAGAGVGVLGGCGGNGAGNAEYPQDYPRSDRQEPDGGPPQGGTGTASCSAAGAQVLVGPVGQSVALFQAVGVAADARYFVCRDGQGLFGVNATCTHAGCLTRYNAATTTWQCPCHGSEYSYEGVVVGGPAPRPLLRYAACEQPDGTTLIDTSQPL